MKKLSSLLFLIVASTFVAKADDPVTPDSVAENAVEKIVDAISEGIDRANDYITSTRIGQMGVKSVNWYNRIFENYDTLYVMPKGTAFRVRLSTRNRMEFYRLNFHDGGFMNIRSNLASNIGIHLGYRMISFGIYENLTRTHDGKKHRRHNFEMAFNNARFSLNVFVQENTLKADITHFYRPPINYHKARFDGLSTNRWGFEFYYFFNNRRYSQEAAFAYSRIQRKSQGSFFMGLAFYHQDYTFNFSTLPSVILENLPSELENHTYEAHTRDICITGGYAFNWAINRHWLLAFAEAPIVGYRTGRVNPLLKTSLSFSNQAKVSAIYTFGRFFAALQGTLFTSFTRDHQISLVENLMSLEASFGCHFNL